MYATSENMFYEAFYMGRKRHILPLTSECQYSYVLLLFVKPSTVQASLPYFLSSLKVSSHLYKKNISSHSLNTIPPMLTCGNMSPNVIVKRFQTVRISAEKLEYRPPAMRLARPITFYLISNILSHVHIVQNIER